MSEREGGQTERERERQGQSRNAGTTNERIKKRYSGEERKNRWGMLRGVR